MYIIVMTNLLSLGCSFDLCLQQMFLKRNLTSFIKHKIAKLVYESTSSFGLAQRTTNARNIYTPAVQMRFHWMKPDPKTIPMKTADALPSTHSYLYVTLLVYNIIICCF